MRLSQEQLANPIQRARATDIVIQTAKEEPYGFNIATLRKELSPDSFVQLKRLQALVLEFMTTKQAKAIFDHLPSDLTEKSSALFFVRSAFYRQETAKLLEKRDRLAAAGDYGYAARLFTRATKLGFTMDQRINGREVQPVEYYGLIAGFFRSAAIYNDAEQFDKAMEIGVEGVSAFLNNRWRGDLFSVVQEGESLPAIPSLEVRHYRLNKKNKREMADYLANLVIPYELDCRARGSEASSTSNSHYQAAMALIQKLRF